jgi:phosphoglycerate dehydrogenase-like enzyme
MTKLRIFVDFIAEAEVMEILRQGTAGHELVFPKRPVASILAKAEPDPGLVDADVAFGQPDPNAVEQARGLKWIHISTSSITRYDHPEFRELVARRNIPVSNSARVYQESCAVHVLSFMLAQARKLPLALVTRSASGTPPWNALRTSVRTLRGETALILGYGAIGKQLVELLRPFEMKVIGFRRKSRGDEEVPVITAEKLAHTLSMADHVIDILPDSAETKHFFNAARFKLLKPGAVFYNIGRGATVEQQALADALGSGRLTAAWLDVTEPEPLPDDHPLRAAPNCFVTPHIAGGHVGESQTLVRHFLGNLQRFVRNEPLLDRVM